MDAGFMSPGSGGLPISNKGTATPAANGVLTAFSAAHGLGAVPTFVSVMPGNALSAGDFWVTSDATNVTINYVVAPTTGALNLKWKAEL